MGSLFENLQKKGFLPTPPYKDELPTFQTHEPKGLRKRISSFSAKMPPFPTTASAAWAFRRSKSMPALGEFARLPLRRWWDSWWGWVLSRKPAFAEDVEMNEEEAAMLGGHSRGSWRHLIYRVRSEIRKLMRSNSLPTTATHSQGISHDSFGYALNFGDGKPQTYNAD